jgi:hypothetical protein
MEQGKDVSSSLPSAQINHRATTITVDDALKMVETFLAAVMAVLANS